MSASVTLACLVLLAACAAGGASPSPPPDGMPLPGGIEARARARVRADNPGPAVLEVTVTFYNPGHAPVDLAVLAHCPLLLRLRPTAGGQPGPAYDDTGRPCARSARVVRVPARGEAELTRALSLAELRAAGLVAGRYRAEVIVTVGPKPIEVDAGEADLEIPGRA